jgi:hypothetical protein
MRTPLAVGQVRRDPDNPQCTVKVLWCDNSACQVEYDYGPPMFLRRREVERWPVIPTTKER